MAISDFIKRIADNRALVERNKAQARRIAAMEVVQIQLTKDIITAGAMDEETKRFRGNEYKTYEAAVAGLDLKYNGLADWGGLQVGNIVDIRAAFIIAEGIQVSDVVEGEGNQELDFAKKFLSYNDLDEEMAQEYAKEAELEGKILIKLAWEPDAKMVSARFVSWTLKRYVIETEPDDYSKYIKATWTEKDGQKKNLEAKDFVYKKFGGRIYSPNSAAPKIMKCLTQIDNLDKALRDLREINRIFASPIPILKFEDPDVAKGAQADLDKINWKIKKIFSTTGEFQYGQPSMQGVDALLKEIEALAKVISGATGAPVHFLGFPDLLSNRATAENLMELIYSSTLKERTAWTGAYKEIIAKAMAIYSDEAGGKLDPAKINIEIPFVSEKNWAIVEKIFIPLSLGGKISDELLLSRIPGVNIKEEMARKKALEVKSPLGDKDEGGDEEIDTDETDLLTSQKKEVTK
jgi:hypothetical protein